MWKTLQKINKNLIVAIPVLMVTGFLTGMFIDAAPLKQLIVPFTFLMVYPMMVTLKIKKVIEGGDTKAQILTQVINFGIIPFIAFGLGRIFFQDQPYMALGLLMAGLVPTSGMTISWTGFAKGNVAAAVKMTVIGLTLGSLATPFYVRALMGAALEVNIAAVMKQIAIIVFIPMIAGYLTQQALVKKYGRKAFQSRLAPRFPALSTLGVLGIVFIAMALKAKAIAGSPQLLLFLLAPLAIIYALNFFISTLVGRLFLPRGDAIALVYGSVMRNLSIALAIAINAFGPQGSSAALVVAMAYIIQVQSAAWYVKFADRLFGKAAEDVRPDLVKETGAKGPATPALSGVQSHEEKLVPAFRKILYATDLSETARHALHYACSLGNRYGAEVDLLHVVHDVLEAYESEAGVGLSADGLEKTRRQLNQKAIDDATKKIRQRIRETAGQVIKEIPKCPLAAEKTIVQVGDPADRIIETAGTGNYDLVIMGTHGHSKLDDWVLGSVATDVVHRCPVPVMVVRLPRQHLHARVQKPPKTNDLEERCTIGDSL
ncbi:MAG: universal stress protein [Desulfobacteraceae bacterium]|jgi:ACR3 family arsenite efflux pump ArsB/nucleotide-binding universal stress UspA family protein